MGDGEDKASIIFLNQTVQGQLRGPAYFRASAWILRERWGYSSSLQTGGEGAGHD